MYRIGLTGGVGSGKSTVSSYMKEFGIPVIDGDCLAMEAVAPGNIATIQRQHDEMSSEIMEQCNMIMLMLNPAKPDQANLYDVLQQVLKFIQRVFQQAPSTITNLDDIEYAGYKQAAFDAMTCLGVETWRQVKSLS